MCVLAAVGAASPAMTSKNDSRITVIQRELFEPGRSRFERYRDLVVGRRNVWAWFRYELIVLLCSDCRAHWVCSFVPSCIPCCSDEVVAT